MYLTLEKEITSRVHIKLKIQSCIMRIMIILVLVVMLQVRQILVVFLLLRILRHIWRTHATSKLIVKVTLTINLLKSGASRQPRIKALM